MPHFLEKLNLTDIRGIYDLEVDFKYPVSVLAGSNGSGKSTVLLATACAYALPGTGEEGSGFSPSQFFLDYQSKSSGQEDKKGAFVVGFEYSTSDGSDGKGSTALMCPKDWQGIPSTYAGDKQPECSVYLITPGNAVHPSEMGTVHRMSHAMLHEADEPQERPLTLPQIAFAHLLLPFRYSRVTDLRHPNFNFGNEASMLQAEQENGVVYSEFHMAAGERAILRMSKKIAQVKDALILIDEVETGLHPSIQKSLMLELQQLALRNDLQIIVTTHSPVVLDSVPQDGRIFLDRNEEGKIVVHPPHRDLIQDALYGRVDEKFNLLCEDNAAQGVLEGVFDIIIPRLLAKRDSIRIDRDTGAEEFPRYARMFKRCGQLESFIFVLDGDQRNEEVKSEIISVFMDDKKNRSEEEKEQDRVKYQGRVMFLPGKGAPEEWVWDRMRTCLDDFAAGLGLDRDDLARQMKRKDADYASATGLPSEIAKNKLHDLSEVAKHSVPEICRIVSRRETELIGSCREMELEEDKIQPLVEELVDAFQTWRSGTSETG